MRYYPAMLDINDRKCVVVGGGTVAERKVNSLLECSANVTVISPEICSGIQELHNQGHIRAIERAYCSGDLNGAVLIIAATDNPEINHQVYNDGQAQGMLVNTVDDITNSNFIVPSSFRRGDLLIAISTGGSSPALARKIRTALEKDYGEEYESLVALVGEVRADLVVRGIKVSPECWQDALAMKSLQGLIRRGRYEEAKRNLLAKLEASSPEE